MEDEKLSTVSMLNQIASWVNGKIELVKAYFPSQADPDTNPLADKAFVNSSIATATATFRGTYNVVSDLSLAYNATHAQIEAALATKMSALSITPDNNDYAFVQIPTSATSTDIEKVEKYKFNGTAWGFEYELNNSGFTASQWAAINSGATLELIGKLSALPTNAELTTLLNAKADKSEMSITDGTGADADKATIQLKSGTSATVLKSHIPQDNAPTENSNNNVKSGGIFSWVSGLISTLRGLLLEGDLVPAMAETLAPWADQKAIATPDTYTDAVRTTGGDIPIETSAGSKLESIKPVAGSKWTAKLLFNGSYNMLNAAKWGVANSQPYVGGVGGVDDVKFVYFLVPELTLGTFGTADENNGLLFTDSEGENVQPTSVYYKPLGSTVPQSLTDGTSVSPTSVNYDGNVYKTYETSGAGWLIIPKTYYDNDVCAHIAWEDWYDKHVSLNEPTTNPEAVVGILILEGLLALAHSDKYLRGVNDEVCDNVVFGDTSATITHMVDELSVAANAWTNSATGESDSHGNALYRHSATVSGIKQGGAACIEGEDGGIPLTVNGTTVSYVDTNATISEAKTVFYQIPTTAVVEKAYSDTVFNGSNINQETGVLPINDCSIEAQVAMAGTANITVKYAKNIVDQVAINAATDVPKLQEQVEDHEVRVKKLENTTVKTNSYDASVAVGLADNFKGDTIVDAEFYKRKTGGTQSVGSGIAAIKEVKGNSIVWNQLARMPGDNTSNGVVFTVDANAGTITANGTATGNATSRTLVSSVEVGHKYILKGCPSGGTNSTYRLRFSIGSISELGNGMMFTGNDTIGNLIVNIREGYTANNLVFKPMLIDLTLMFGAGNEPATVAEFEKMFPLDYYDYNAGEVIPFAGQNLVTTGFNQWDEQWESGGINVSTGEYIADASLSRSKNYISVFPNTRYYSYNGTWNRIRMIYYDNNKTFISSYQASGNGEFTTPSNCRYVKFYWLGKTYNNDICINLSNPDRNGTYEPYEKHTLPLDPSQWRDKNGDLVFPYGGMQGVGTAYDYAKVDADGYIRKAVRVFGQLDISKQVITIESASAGRFFFNKNSIKYNTLRLLCTKGYSPQIEGPVYQDMEMRATNSQQLLLLRITDSHCANMTTAQIKAYMQDTFLVYELAEHVEVELATPVYAKYLVDKDGTEEITPANGSTPYTTMANISILYAMDARGEIKNLPKNYLSKESTENMLNAMVSAGVIASYTMTWDSTNSRYVFVIQKNSEQ